MKEREGEILALAFLSLHLLFPVLGSSLFLLLSSSCSSFGGRTNILPLWTAKSFQTSTINPQHSCALAFPDGPGLVAVGLAVNLEHNTYT